MLNAIFRFKSILIFNFLTAVCLNLYAQKTELEVIRISSIDRALPVNNVVIDGSGRKWVANNKGIFNVRASDLSMPLNLGATERCVLAYHGGNSDFRWDEKAMQQALKGNYTINAASYDAKTKQLWIGTEEAGLFLLKTDPQLALVQQFTQANSKLKSNSITTLFLDASGRIWVGSTKGIMYGTAGRWKGDFTNYSVQRIREYGNVIFVLADGEISKAPNGDRWTDLYLDTKKFEGNINDFDIDAEGNMWLVSGWLTRFNLVTEAYDVFAGPEDYTSQFGTHIAVDPLGQVLVGTSDKGVFQVDKGSAMTLNAFVDKPVSCTGENAILMAKVTGGDPPYNYIWSGGLSGENPKNVAPGNYKITVTDSKGKSRTAEIQVPDTRLKILTRQKKPVSAPNAADGAAEVDIATNASGLLINWDNGETYAVASRLTAGLHKVTVTDPKGCTAVAEINVTLADQPLAIAILPVLGIGCAGDKTAKLEVRTAGGKAPFKFTWNNTAAQGQTPDKLGAGNYSVTVTDAAGKTATAQIPINQPDGIDAKAMVIAAASMGVADGRARVEPKGGTPPYRFKWDNGELGMEATRLTPGQHTVTVSDNRGCWISTAVEIKENISALSAKIELLQPIRCPGQKANISVSVTGGKMPIRYTWKEGIASGKDAKDVNPGIYELTVTDAANQTATASISIESPKAIGLSVSVSAPASTGNADGKASVKVSGGTPPFSFKWTNGENVADAQKLPPGENSVTVIDANGCAAITTVNILENILPLSVQVSNYGEIRCAGEKTAGLAVKVNGGKSPFQYKWNSPALTGENPINLSAGDYSLTVSDASGKTATASITVQQPQPLAAAAAVLAAASTENSDGKASVEAKGGAGSFTYRWDNGENTAEAVRLAPGQRSVTVTDANGCSATATVAISENILPLTVQLNETSSIKCAGEKTAELSAKISGGKKPFQYSWNNAVARGETAVGLSSGDYSVTVTDVTGKTATANYSVKAPQSLVISALATAPASTGNSDGKANAEVKGGAGNYKYSWDNGETSAQAIKLPPGNHSVTVTDGNGCSANAAVTITENILPLAVAIKEKNKVKCAGETAGLAVEVQGGKPPYQYKWNKNDLYGESATGLGTGDYSVTVTDALGSSKTVQTSVLVPAPLKIELVRNIGTTTERSNDGKAQVAVSGGTPKYEIVWDTKQTGTAAVKLPFGKHTVTVTDANGCQQTVAFQTEKRILPELTGNLEDGQTIRMRTLRFDPDSTSLKPDALPLLDELFDFMMENGGVVIEVAGHTNNLPSDAFADKLSTERAKSVADYLFSKGVDPKRVVFKGYGKRQPVAPNTTPEGRSINQRVEIKIVKIVK